MNSLLPPSTTRLERGLERAGQLELDAPLRNLWSEDSAPEHILPYLAWSLDVDFWNMAETPEQRRALIGGAIAWHKKRGTPWAVKQALAAFGYNDTQIIEHSEYLDRWSAAGGRALDGTWLTNGLHNLSWDADLPEDSDLRRFTMGHWAEYAIRTNSTDSWSRTDQRKIRQIAEAYAPLRSQLATIIGGMRLPFSSLIKLESTNYKIRLAFSRCQALSVHGRLTLSGCWEIGGSYTAKEINGWKLSGFQNLDGIMPVSGFEWAKGQISIRMKVRIQLSHNMQKNSEPQLMAGRTRVLDGRFGLGENLLDGASDLNSRILTGPLLTRYSAPDLDGWHLVQPDKKTITCRLQKRKRSSGDYS